MYAYLMYLFIYLCACACVCEKNETEMLELPPNFATTSRLNVILLCRKLTIYAQCAKLTKIISLLISGEASEGLEASESLVCPTGCSLSTFKF